MCLVLYCGITPIHKHTQGFKPMKFLRIPTLVAITALVVTSCNSEGDNASQAATNPLLAFVPTDTPYLFANTEPTPPEVIDAFIVRLAPSLLMAQTLLDDFKLEVNSDDPAEHNEARLLSAILAEFDGKLNREGLEGIGLSLESNKVIYGMGVFPVVRIALQDASALRAAIARVETASGMTFASLKSGDTGYWKISGHRNGEVNVYIAILDDHVAFSMFPAAAEAEWLPAFLGQSKPAESIASSNMLSELNKSKGYTNYGSGFLDLQKMADELLNENSRTASLLKSIGHYQPADFGEVCINEVKALVAKVPRIVGGTTELTPNTIGISYQLELESTLAAKLVQLVAKVPVADKNPNKIFSASVGLRVGRLRNFVMEQINAVVANPFECDKFRGLNAQAQAVADKLNVPIMPFINNLKGFRVSLDEVDFENFQPENARGMFSLEVEKPQMLIGMAQMFIPGMDGLELEPGADPIEVPQELMSFSSDSLHVFAAMSKDAIGIASGENRMQDLAAFMEADEDNGNVFFSVEYDMSAPMEFQRQLLQQAGNDNEEFQNLVANIQESYMQWLGRSRVEASFTEEGLQVDTKITFK